MKIGIIIQARMTSTRLPGKILLDLAGKPVLWHVAERSKKANVDEVIVATTNNKTDDVVVDFCKKNNIKFFRGSEENVLERYYLSAKENKLDHVIRVTSDCPLIDPDIINKLIKKYFEGKNDYVSNVLSKRTFPRGLDIEIFSFKTLEYLHNICKSSREREHVTLFIRENKELFKTFNFENKTDLSRYRWTLDEKEDFVLIKKIYSYLYKNNNFFTTIDVLNLLKNIPELENINKKVKQKKNIYNATN